MPDQGVENGLICAGMKDDQHQVLFIQQESDGVSLDDELLSSFYRIDGNDQPNHIPDVEFRFDSEDEPNDDDLATASEMLKNLMAANNCWGEYDVHATHMDKIFIGKIDWFICVYHQTRQYKKILHEI